MRVAVLGAAMTPFGERDARLPELLVEAGELCLADAGVSPAAIDHLFVTQSGGAYEAQGGLMALLASDLGLETVHAEAVEQTSAAGAAGIYAAWRAIESGASDLALVVGGEKLTRATTAETTDRVSAIAHPAAYKHGVTIPTFAGLTARRYLHRFDASREALAEVAVKNHDNGVDNPKAHFRTAIDVETVLSSPIVADPLRLYDFCPISDGSAALVLASEATARAYADEYAVIAGIGGATGTHVVHERTDLAAMSAVEDAAERAYAMADRRPEDVDIVEVHDMFTILELLQLEALGFAERGSAWRLVEAGETRRDGRLPVNTSGGLKAKGHPIAASGIAQVVELSDQLLGRAGARQVDAATAMACNVGGFGNCAVSTLLERR